MSSGLSIQWIRRSRRNQPSDWESLETPLRGGARAVAKWRGIAAGSVDRIGVTQEHSVVYIVVADQRKRKFSLPDTAKPHGSSVRYVLRTRLNNRRSSQVDSMSSSIALLVFVALVATGCTLFRYRGRRSGDPWRLLRDLSPVSGQWLADYRRSG